jgi:hypothetical protein
MKPTPHVQLLPKESLSIADEIIRFLHDAGSRLEAFVLLCL